MHHFLWLSKPNLNSPGKRWFRNKDHLFPENKEVAHMPRVTFRLDYPEAKSVSIAGSFNEWNPTTHPLRKTKKGYWSITITLPRGRHEYRYLVDDRWFTDPDSEKVPNEFGSHNSVIIVE